MTKRSFRETKDGYEITRTVHVSIAVTMLYGADELAWLTKEKLDRDSIENFLDHPALESVADMEMFVDKITTELNGSTQAI
jgi:hypothetical protein